MKRTSDIAVSSTSCNVWRNGVVIMAYPRTPVNDIRQDALRPGRNLFWSSAFRDSERAPGSPDGCVSAWAWLPRGEQSRSGARLERRGQG